MKYFLSNIFNLILLILYLSVILFSIVCYNTLQENGIPSEAYFLFQKGIKYGKKADIKNALQSFSDAIEEDNDLVWAYLEKAKIYYFTQKKRKSSIADLSKAINLKSDSYDAYIYRGIVYLNSGKYEIAINDFDKALDIYPYSSVAYLNIANAYLNIGDYSKALSAYKSILQIYPENKNAIQGRRNLVHLLIQSDLTRRK